MKLRLASTFTSFACAAATLVSVNAAARADETGPLTAEATLGVQTPLGFGGLALEYAPAPYVSVAAGAGLGASGPQLAAMTYGHTRLGRADLSAGAGLSGGRYELDTGFPGLSEPPTYSWDRAYWLNGELSAAYHFDSGIRVRLFGGTGYLLNREADSCVEGDSAGPCMNEDPEPVGFLPYLGLGVGYSF